MNAYLLLFHNTPGVLQTRKALQAANVEFRVQDIPRALRGGCGLCIRLHCLPEDALRWVIPGATQAIYRCAGEEYVLVKEC
ncbi:DUF3343 domain-containing protein [Vagococcus sp. WN89Y]|uniref:DUF3343 domain-containing protein n=1 Tax=Vagococcus sp. WN89Y TaxID=3457258 RepID=UPI003FCCE03F